MKLLFTVVISLFIAYPGFSQPLIAEFEAEFQTNSSNQFPLREGVLNISQSLYVFGSESQVDIMTPISVAVSPEKNNVGIVRFDNTLKGEVYNYSGLKISETELEFVDSADETIVLQVMGNGGFVVRDNVANFTFFDAAGRTGYSLSNATQATGGEQPSGLSVSESGEIAVVYNPVIQYDGSRGSRASFAMGDRESNEFYHSRSHTIDRLSVSKNGSFITVITSGGNNSRVHLYDRFGNELLNMEAEMDVTGYDITDDGRYLTIYSDNRVQVFRTADRERLGSSTSRSTIVHAAYHPEEDTIISFGGQSQSGNVSNPEITAIHLGKRQLEREQLGGTVSMLDKADIDITRTNAGSYYITGLNKPIRVTARF